MTTIGNMQTFEVVMDRLPPVYHPGEVVGGEVKLELNQSMKLKAIKVIFQGQASVEWDELTWTDMPKMAGTEVYLEETKTIFSAAGAFSKSLLGPLGSSLKKGAHSFPFECTLPTDVPPTFKGEFGTIKYKVQGVIERPWNKSNYVSQTQFAVQDVCDPSTDRGYRTPSVASKDKQTTRYCGLVSRSVELEARTDRGVYGPGDQVQLTVHIRNQCGCRITHTKATLTRDIIYRGKLKRKGSRKLQKKQVADVVVSTRGRGVDRRQNMQWTEPLAIPIDTPVTLKNSKLISVDYELKVSAKASDPRYDLDVYIPLRISNFPDDMGFPGQLTDIPSPLPSNTSFRSPRGMSPLSSNTSLPTPGATSWTSDRSSLSRDTRWGSPEGAAAQPAEAEEPPPSYDECMAADTTTTASPPKKRKAPPAPSRI
ncbi:PREDICTED: arrestin domain-containing protein 1-like isoform X1 [Branchiostoma belcheri]|uniref:Arrestin domain-containing protein 1-like isoform X1 n=1 Tax=Branchiostoma belcheri TaxID=7741 RepID=A0A6P4YN13_BRABE|nr:PREDICTED: arrestin domain-containing protein 1-like isoform X1 [Branchiostoma belcheri]XP_019630860.1 PREDICTED: arrestin domain-containing protein 1-like isoform X1 [Branchiostoma belcheri]